MQSNIDIKNFASAIAQIAEEKGISPEKILETIEMAIAAAYKKEYGKRGQVIKAKLDPGTGELKLWQVKQVLDKSMVYTEEELEKLKEKGKEIQEDEEGKKLRFNPEKHIMAEEARKIKPKIKPGEELETALEPKGDYGGLPLRPLNRLSLNGFESQKEKVFLMSIKGKKGKSFQESSRELKGGMFLWISEKP